jgi:hypothetical protein
MIRKRHLLPIILVLLLIEECLLVYECLYYLFKDA